MSSSNSRATSNGRAGRPDAQHVIRGDEAQRREPGALHPFRQQHPERLMGVAAFEAISNQIPAVAAGECLHQQVVSPGQPGAGPLQSQPALHVLQEDAPTCRLLHQAAHAVGKVGGQRQAPAFIGRHHRLAAAAFRHFGDRFMHAQEAQQASGKHEGIGGTQHVDEILLDFPQDRPESLFAHQPDLHLRCIDDGADVHPVLPGNPLGADMPPTFRVAEQLAVSVVSGERVAAVLDEIQHGVEILARQLGIRCGTADFGEHCVRAERRRAGHAEKMLGKHVEPAGPWGVAVQLARGNARQGGLAFQQLEPVGRHQHGAACFLHAMVGATDALQQAGDAFRRAELDHLIDAAPVDAEIKRRRRDDCAQPALGHRSFHAAALRYVQAAVVQRDRQSGLIESPQRLKDQLGPDEDDRHAGGADARHHLRRRFRTHVAGPGQLALGQHDRQVRWHAVCRVDAPGSADIGLDGIWMGDGGGQADAPQLRGERAEPRRTQRQLVAALGAGERVHLVHDQGREAAEHRRRLWQRQQHRKAFGRSKQDVRWGLALASAPVGRRIAGPGFYRNGKLKALDEGHEVAGDIGRQRLQRTDVERVQARTRIGCQLDQRRQETGECLPAAGRRDQQHAFARGRRVQHGELMRPRLPASGREPGSEVWWQAHGRITATVDHSACTRGSRGGGNVPSSGRISRAAVRYASSPGDITGGSSVGQGRQAHSTAGAPANQDGGAGRGAAPHQLSVFSF